MNLQSHHSGQIGQVSNQTGASFSGLQLQNGNPLLGQIQNPGMHRVSNVDPEFQKMRRFMQERIWQFLMQRRQQNQEVPKQKMFDLVRKLEEGLLRSAKTTEEYLNLVTLESRLLVLIKSMPFSNQSQQFQHTNLVPSMGTMMPTPGLQNPGNLSMIGTSSGDGYLASNNISSSTLYSGNFMPTGNGSFGNMNAGSFSASEGLLAGPYQQSSAFSVNSGGNKMVTSIDQRRVTGQMIPTPGFSGSNNNDVNNNSNNNSSNNNDNTYNNNNQPFINVESHSNVGVSTIESTIASQPMQQKLHVGGQNSRILHNLGGPMGGGIRSTLQQKSYGLANGNLNTHGALGMMGNSMPLINGAGSTESYSTGPMYGNSMKPMHHSFEQQQRPVIQGDGCGLAQTDGSGSGNLYVPATAAGSTTNNQSWNAVAQSMPKAHASLMTNPSTAHSTQQVTATKSEPIDQLDNMNFQAQYMVRENSVQPHQPPLFQQPSHQFQRQAQQKQQNQNQNLPNNDNFRQSQLSSNLVSETKLGAGNDHRIEGLHSQVSNPFEFSDMQGQFQQNSIDNHSGASQLLSHPSGLQDISSSFTRTPDQMQHSMLTLSQQFISNPHNDFCALSGGTEPDSTSHGKWYSKNQDVSHLSGRDQHDQQLQSEFHQRLTGKETANLNNLSSEESMIGQSDASRSADPPNLCNTVRQSYNLSRERQYKDQVRWLLFLRHARRCPFPEGQCHESNCLKVQELWKHMEHCKELQCSYPRCQHSKELINHHKQCRDADCPVCIPHNNYLLKASTLSDFDSRIPGSANRSCKSHDTAEIAGMSHERTSPAVAETPEDLQPSTKRIKVEQGSHLLTSQSEGSVALLSGKSENPLQDTQHVDRPHESHPLVKCEAAEVKVEGPEHVNQLLSNISKMKNESMDQIYTQKPDNGSALTDLTSGMCQEVAVNEKEMPQKVEENSALPSETTSKSGKPKINGVSMIELFTPEQVRQHITGLRQWVGQSKAKAEKNQAMEHSMSENSCQLCAVERLTFEPPPLYCTPCGARLKRNAMYYTIGAGETRHYFCIPCYNEARGDTMVVEGMTIPKAKMEKKKNDEETEEWWVQCDKCEAWQHQICALFNGRRNDGGSAEYTCPNCYVEEVERGERVPLPQSAVLGAKDLPGTILSDHIEHRLFTKLRQERLDRARVQGKSYDEVPGADSLVVRVVSSVDKKLEVKPRFLEIFQEDNYPIEFPYKSKVVLLFQKIEGVEVCLFGMYVQEFGSECDQPNHRRVYLSYLDSVKYFRPDVRAVTGEALRTFVYHEILIGYLEYCKMRGFSSCYIWACPPLKGEDYILYCHPEIQKTPKSDKLREWYLAMLRKAAKENVVVELTNLYEHFFVSNGECRAKVTAARLPYFDGDYWPGAAEDMIFQLQQEDDGRKHNKKGMLKKTITKRALKASGQTDLSGNTSKDLMLMHKLGETISPMKEDFIMVHLQHSCTHCCILMVSGNRWVCRQCKKFELCDRCYEAERKREDRERHPIHHKDKHALYPVAITEIADDTKDKDDILESEFFDTRQAFLSLCQGNHYQYDTLRRAKHSSMMVLYHLHNPTAPAFVTTCNVCTLDIETGQGWRCEICAEYDVCNACYEKEGAVDHPHKLTNHPSNDRDAQNTEARQLRVMQLKKMLELLVHASQCRSVQCQYPNCRKVKGLFRHGMLCKVRASGGCLLCKKMWYLLQLHARACKESSCSVPRCRDLKEHMRRLQQQSDSRRRAAVNEMMRQRAAEVASNS